MSGLRPRSQCPGRGRARHHRELATALHQHALPRPRRRLLPATRPGQDDALRHQTSPRARAHRPVRPDRLSPAAANRVVFTSVWPRAVTARHANQRQRHHAEKNRAGRPATSWEAGPPMPTWQTSSHISSLGSTRI